MTDYSVGTLVSARGRDWVVLPDSNKKLLHVRPLGGSDEEVTAICTEIENVSPAELSLPRPEEVSDFFSSQLMRDAVRLGFRSSAGPFRSFARLGFEPRPYQLVPLLMALQQDIVRILISDDVGIGKTIEAGLIARELLDRGEVTKLAILCPPQLAEQWHTEMREKFHIDCKQVLPSTVKSLERNCRFGETVFDLYDHFIVSTDFIKADRHREDFLRKCPALVIVDEAHTCATTALKGSSHQRFKLVNGLSEDLERHMICLTATPHSGKGDVFRSLLGFLRPEFVDMPSDLSGDHNRRFRDRLARHFIQRRRNDIIHYMDEETLFPEALEKEETYTLHQEYKDLFKRVVEYARETIKLEDDDNHRQRIRWWSALALLRSMASSPAAAAATLISRAASADTVSVEDADEIGMRAVLDLDDDDDSVRMDIAPGALIDEEAGSKHSAFLRSLAREAEALKGDKDNKLIGLVKTLKKLIKNGSNPIIFCRFIPTAEYIAEELRKKFKKIEIAAVTSTLPHHERKIRVESMGEAEQRILVCTDCLSEGINLQRDFDSVIHYDLSWNPTCHEQREGRVNRFGQQKEHVHILNYYGTDNMIDGAVLKVLINKHNEIKKDLKVAIPLPDNSSAVMEALMESLLLSGEQTMHDQFLPGFEDIMTPKLKDYFDSWEKAGNNEKVGFNIFKHVKDSSIRVEEVRKELESVRKAIGSRTDVERFVRNALEAYKAILIDEDNVLKIDLQEVPGVLREQLAEKSDLTARFDLPLKNNEVLLHRTSPFVENLATYVLDTALDPAIDSLASRCGVIRSSQVDLKTTVLLLRLRYHIKARGKQPLLAEDCKVVAFQKAPQRAEWLLSDDAERILDIVPESNVSSDIARKNIEDLVDGIPVLTEKLHAFAQEHGESLLESHLRVRPGQSKSFTIEAQLPVDIIGCYVYLP